MMPGEWWCWRGEERRRAVVGLLRLEIFPTPPPPLLGHGDGRECTSLASPLGNYKTELYDPAMEKYQPSPQWINLFVFVKDPENKNLLARQYGPQGSFTFTSQSPGEHQICLHLESIRFALFYDGKLAIHLDMQLGEHSNDYAEFAAKDKLTQLQLRLQQLVEQVELIQKEQEYQRWREERFRQTSESTNQRVLWWSILQTLILVATGVWQMQHLKSFFKAKKLV
uniref:Transmembrane emp24 domain-containing protein 9 n=2 Tax=Ailuropoda melanoleuca TaxID=9646 RepID=A0A7N5JX70_AILME